MTAPPALLPRGGQVLRLTASHLSSCRLHAHINRQPGKHVKHTMLMLLSFGYGLDTHANDKGGCCGWGGLSRTFHMWGSSTCACLNIG